VLGAVAVLATLGAACRDDLGAGATVTTDAALAARLRTLATSGSAVSLRDLTDFDWNTVHVFGEGATSAEIEAVVGEPVLRGSRYLDAGQLLVFELDGDVVRAVSVVPDLLAFDRPSWSAAVRVEAAGGRPGVLQLAEA
jgi:hypothetical protein